ncbi:nitrile hydratase accessory protein [Pacificoceanicola onchidii]|uniref:nitrile hydratase accessory protein n=1 Tax=Pacificoceanicola onchidii TaxID=2562685 RepID=UPI0010A2F075|nr:nitrile hydratase accessory protein [Pacificoceanicola onchidii]
MNQPEAPFDAPWQAQLFGLTVALNEAGLFSWPDWAETFGPRVQNAPAEAYWDVWSEALIALLEARGITDMGAVEVLKTRWQEAARATPHGAPIELSASGA